MKTRIMLTLAVCSVSPCIADTNNLSVATIRQGNISFTLSNVVSVAKCTEGDNCQRVLYLIGGKTNHFHAWMAEVKVKPQGK
jgi:hypothetical protein